MHAVRCTHQVAGLTLFLNQLPDAPVAAGPQDAKKRTVPVKMPECSGLGTMGTASGACYATITNRPGSAPQLFLHSSATGGLDFTKASGLDCKGQTPPGDVWLVCFRPWMVCICPCAEACAPFLGVYTCFYRVMRRRQLLNCRMHLLPDRCGSTPAGYIFNPNRDWPNDNLNPPYPQLTGNASALANLCDGLPSCV